MSGRVWDWTVTPVGAPAALPVLDGQITVDDTRNPQVQARLTVPFGTWAEANRFDPFTRSEVVVETRYQAYATGKLAAFAKPAVGTSPGSLATLDWSNKASSPAYLGAAIPATTRRVRRLRLFVTDVTVDETAGTMEVTLASADFLLTELVNFGPPWMPRPAAPTFLWTLDDVWGEFFRTFRLPLWLSETLRNPTSGYAFREAVEPWATGENAWTWLNKVRTDVPGWRYVIDTETNQIGFQQVSGDIAATPAQATAQRLGATSITATRSVETAFEGMNQYADAVAVQWVDQTALDRPDVWEFANAHGDWRLMRRAFVEQRDLHTTAVPALAEARIERMRRFRRMVTVTRPIVANAAPFRDLTDAEAALATQSIVYSYPSGDVTTTYLESEA
ncbi:hypothetical protein GCM10009846_10230 [Agrococcus versicolor]|uniref:Minor tail protein n=1 Tax=Agrococcus versicolor TaxID=501482 RepID=A0ABP5MHE9_9MICO